MQVGGAAAGAAEVAVEYGDNSDWSVRNEGEVIRHNFGWTIVLLVYLVLIGVACYAFFPSIMAGAA